MHIGIIPRIRSVKNNNLEYSVDKKLLDILNKIYKKPKITIIHDYKSKNINLLVISGGNDIKIFSDKKRDTIRNKISIFHLKKSLNKKIPIIGICYGAQLIAKIFKSKLKKYPNHVGDHLIKLKNNKFNKKLKRVIKVNSYHNYSITKLGTNLTSLATAMDNTIEAFKHKKFKVLGIMWHPERYKKIKKIDKKYLLKIK
tara:strand:+ start:815 stop:1411 length:597 start_codon:yes stop_codon:yes gene_type:complete